MIAEKNMSTVPRHATGMAKQEPVVMFAVCDGSVLTPECDIYSTWLEADVACWSNQGIVKVEVREVID